jgi:hypothetical protein
MSVRLSPEFMFSCVGSGLATWLITHPGSLTSCLRNPYIQINSDGKVATGSNTKDRRRRIFIYL